MLAPQTTSVPPSHSRMGKMTFGLITSTGGVNGNRAYGFYFAPRGIPTSSAGVTSATDTGSHIIQMANLQQKADSELPQPTLQKNPRFRNNALNSHRHLPVIVVAIGLIICQILYGLTLTLVNRPLNWRKRAAIIRCLILIASMLGFEAILTAILLLVPFLYTRRLPRIGYGIEHRALNRAIVDTMLAFIYLVCTILTVVHCILIERA
ncbi:MAG: hypothetical protein MMC33_005003 [Icmadophila ericetorum]|nr:hypothetical protein [Icmadophila ericetorum]